MATLEVQPAEPSVFSSSSSMALTLASDATSGPQPARPLSLFERIVTSHPTVLESLLAQLPTASVLDLYHSSRHLRDFLANYPLAWKTLSFRAPQPALAINNPDAEVDGQRAPKQYALDALLIQVVVPFGTRLTSLDLCNTAVSGVRLVSRVLEPRVATLQHLSVRGCKNVSIKYHLVPFLEPYVQPGSPWARKSDLALKSLYTYRCRHHRRRPYLPSSLMRRDSDSEPTHQLIEICHQLGIWTDTTWCTTPGSRCFRRKDYYSGRAAPGTNEVWVPFDRLWRSGNRIGPSDSSNPPRHSDGRLWEDSETGHDGEPLGTSNGWPFKGEGKDVPAHLRRSHRMFVEDVKCDSCGDAILERCEQCSIRMHCMGCRKTLCASCAFNRPLPRKRQKTQQGFTALAFGTSTPLGTNNTISNHPSNVSSSQHTTGNARRKERFWWAPGATRSPNLMTEITSDDEDSESDEPTPNIAAVPIHINAVNNLSMINGPGNVQPPKLNMHWCCVEPVFSGGGGIVVLGPAIGGKGADRIRATPLPKGQNYEDADFASVLRSPDVIRELKNATLYEHILGEDVDILPYLQQGSLDLQASSCPRSLCQDCYRTFRWKVSCGACKKPLCKEHDFRALKVRKCGFRDLHTEREYVRSQPPTPAPSRVDALHIPAFIPPELRNLEPPTMAQQGSTDSHASSAAPDQTLTQPIGGALNPDNPMAASTSFITPQLSPHPSHSHPSHSHPRPRSVSFSDTRPSRSSSPWPKPGASSSSSAIQAAAVAAQRVRVPLPLPCHPRHPVQWEGCGAYFCQPLRPVGDTRPRCSTGMRECGDCQVLVCDGCLNVNPPCPCAYCSTHYHCPVCAQKPRIRALCRREAEIAAARAKELAEQERLKREVEALHRADEMAEAFGEFMRNWNEEASSTRSGVSSMQRASNGSLWAGEDSDEKQDTVEHVEYADPTPDSEQPPPQTEQEQYEDEDEDNDDETESPLNNNTYGHPTISDAETALLSESQRATLAALPPTPRAKLSAEMLETAWSAVQEHEHEAAWAAWEKALQWTEPSVFLPGDDAVDGCSGNGESSSSGGVASASASASTASAVAAASAAAGAAEAGTSAESSRYHASYVKTLGQKNGGEPYDAVRRLECERAAFEELKERFQKKLRAHREKHMAAQMQVEHGEGGEKGEREGKMKGKEEASANGVVEDASEAAERDDKERGDETGEDDADVDVDVDADADAETAEGAASPSAASASEAMGDSSLEVPVEA